VLGLAFEVHLKLFGTFKFLLSPIRAVGVMAKFIKFIIGYQYQCCMNITSPTMAFYLKFPSLVVREIVAFLPAAFKIP